MLPLPSLAYGSDQAGPQGSPGASESLALTQSPCLLQAVLRRTLSREALGLSAKEMEDWPG